MGLRLRREIFVTPVAVHPLINLISNFWSVTREKHEGNDRQRFPWKDVLEVKARLRTCIASECMVSSTAVRSTYSTFGVLVQQKWQKIAEIAEIAKPSEGWGKADLQAGIGASIGVIILEVQR